VPLSPSFGYNADVVIGNSTADIVDHAKDHAKDLFGSLNLINENKRTKVGDRPSTFERSGGPERTPSPIGRLPSPGSQTPPRLKLQVNAPHDQGRIKQCRNPLDLDARTVLLRLI
jgi:hypothetical protein